MPIDYLVTDTELSDIADAIRAKGGTSAAITFPNGFTTAIAAIPTGITPTGTINITASGNTDVTNYATASVAAGSVSVPATTITANPTISVGSGGLITASVSKTQSVSPSVSAGYVSSGAAGTMTVSGSNTQQLAVQAAQTITPTTTAQTIASGKYLTGAQTIEAVVCSNLTAENIVNGVTVKVGTAMDDDSVASVTGTASGGTWQPVDRNAVNFYDYDGTILYSYTAAEFANLSALPANPSHTGLTAQGWNWTLADAKAQVAAAGTCDIGQMYVTSDGKTRVYIHLEGSRLSPMIGVCPKGTVTVDWGDGTAATTLTGSSVSTVIWSPTHNYAAGGDYVITIAVSGSMGFKGTSTNANGGSNLIRFINSNDSRNRLYRNAVRKIEIGSNVTSLGSYAFYYLGSLETITLPNSVTSISDYAFSSCLSLRHVTIPNSISNGSIGDSTFAYAYSLLSVSLPKLTYVGASCFSETALKSATIPNTVTSAKATLFTSCKKLNSVTLPTGWTSLDSSTFANCECLRAINLPTGLTSIGASQFSGCNSLTKLTIPAGITSLPTSCLAGLFGLSELHFAASTPPTAVSTAFSNLAADCVIYVPTGKLSSYKSAQYYPSSSTYTYVEE